MKQDETQTANNERALREHLLYILRGGGAHIDFDGVVADFPVALMNGKVNGIAYTPWQVLEHMRIAQWDILEFSRNAAHVSPPWPKGYWPDPDDAPGAESWARTVEAFRADLREMENLVADDATDLFAPIPHGEGQTVLREALLIADHNAYHLGVLSTLKRILTETQTAA